MAGGQGSYEIERRYLARVRPGLWATLEGGFSLRQGYVKTGSPSVRIRTGEPRGPVLTCKSGKGVKRHEVEAVVPPEMAEALFRVAGRRVLEKVRYPLGPWELDRFTGELEGLVLLEIELDHEDDPIPAPPPGVSILREVTGDKSFTNSQLARMGEKEKRKLVKKTLREGRS